MYSDIKKDEILEGKDNLQTRGQEKPGNGDIESTACECECECCVKSSKPKLTFASNKNHRFYYQTRSKKQDHN